MFRQLRPFSTIGLPNMLPISYDDRELPEGMMKIDVGLAAVGGELGDLVGLEHPVLGERHVDRLQQLHVLGPAEALGLELLGPVGEAPLGIGLLDLRRRRSPPARSLPHGRVDEVRHHGFDAELDVARVQCGTADSAGRRCLLGRFRRDEHSLGRRAGRNRSQTRCQEIPPIHWRSPMHEFASRFVSREARAESTKNDAAACGPPHRDEPLRSCPEYRPAARAKQKGNCKPTRLSSLNPGSHRAA